MVRAWLLAVLLALPGFAHSQRPPVDAGLDGMYLAVRQNRLSSRVFQDYLTFFPDGRVLRDDPAEGLAVPVDLDAACRDNPCGRYQVEGNTVSIDWESGQSETYERGPDGALRREAGRSYRPVALLDGLRLDGRFAMGNGRGQQVVGITFTPDGRFTESNLLSHTNWVLLGDRLERARAAVPGGTGVYSIRRNTLELRYDSGPTARLVIALPPGQPASPQPEAILIGRSRLRRIS